LRKNLQQESAPYRIFHSRKISASTIGLIGAGILPSAFLRVPLSGMAINSFAASNIGFRAQDRIDSGASSHAIRPMSKASNSSLGFWIDGAQL
jgi:hypothetical protein